MYQSQASTTGSSSSSKDKQAKLEMLKDSAVIWLLFVLFILLMSMLNGCSLLQKKNEASREWLISCGTFQANKDIKYCYHKRPDEESNKTVFFFHGLGDNERVFQESLMNQPSLNEFMNRLHNTAIVTISYGRSWLVTAYPNRWLNPEEATVEYFKQRLLPEISMRFPTPMPFYALGHSMGGQNVATLCLTSPSVFNKCALLNPMLVSCNPWNLFDMECLSAPVIRGHYTKKDWEGYGQDRLLDAADSQKVPPIYVTACGEDKFKLYDPTRDWVLKAQLKNLNLTWEPVINTCSHQSWPVSSVLNFIGEGVSHETH